MCASKRSACFKVGWKGGVFLALCVTGWVLAVVRFATRSEWALLCVLVGPLTVPLFLSLWFPWPFGPERVNLYLVSPIALTILLGWEFALTNRRTTPLRVAFALVFVGLQMPSDLSAYGEKYGRFGNAQEELVPALQAVVDIEGSQSALPSAGCIVFSNMSSYAVRSYSTFHVRTAPRLKAFLAERPHAFVPSREPEQVQASIRRALTSCPRVWIVLSHYALQRRGNRGSAPIVEGTRGGHPLRARLHRRHCPRRTPAAAMAEGRMKDPSRRWAEPCRPRPAASSPRTSGSPPPPIATRCRST
jgi:hypothetical protein